MTDTQKYAVPLERDHYPGAVAGFRAFRFEGGELTALTNSGVASYDDGYPVWSLGVNEASCPKRPHAAPSGDCTCGFWLHRDADALLREEVLYAHEDVPTVLALVAGWGRISDHEEGMRVQYARPVAFFEAERDLLYMYASLFMYTGPFTSRPSSRPDPPTRFAVPEELREPRTCARSGHEGLIERGDMDRVIGEYGLTRLPRQKAKELTLYRRPPGLANGEDELVFAPKKEPPGKGFFEVGKWIEATSRGRYYYAGEESSISQRHMEDMHRAQFGDPEEPESLHIVCPEALLDRLSPRDDRPAESASGSVPVPSPVPETYLAFCRDIMRLAERPLQARPFVRHSFTRGYGDLAGYSADKLRSYRRELEVQVRLVELAISGEMLAARGDRTTAQEEQIDRLFERREKYLGDVSSLEAKISAAEARERDAAIETSHDADAMYRRMLEAASFHPAHLATPPIHNWQAHPRSHLWASPPRKVLTFPPDIAVPEEDEPDCCPPGTHPADHICRRVWLFVCRAARRASEALGKLRPEVFRGARPSNASPLWYTFHRKEK